jgi:hypothetical protein
MQKDELIQLHSLLCQVKRFLETDDQSDAGKRFAEYANLGVAPQHIHKSKTLHKKAVFLLGKEIAGVVAQRLPPGPERDRLVARFTRLSDADGHEVRREPMSLFA